MKDFEKQREKWVSGAIVVGAGPSGLATGACLQKIGVPSLILERANCIASMWRLKTYDRLRLHLPKHFCELPFFPFPQDYPTYPSKHQFVAYLDAYASHHRLQPSFNSTVKNAEFEPDERVWRVEATIGDRGETVRYVCRWLIVAAGENAEETVPRIEGMGEFEGPAIHTSQYKNGEAFRKQRVLVVGCGNSGMEVCLDLCSAGAFPFLVVRDSVHVLPQKILGRSTFGLSAWLLNWFSIAMVDRFLLLISWFLLGDLAHLGLNRPGLGPLQLKDATGKTPILDIGTLAKIKNGEIKVRRGIKSLGRREAEFVDGTVENFDSIIFATGYTNNISAWLKESRVSLKKDGLLRKLFPNGWKGEDGLYAVGFRNRGLLGASIDAQNVAQDIEQFWKNEAAKKMISLREKSFLERLNERFPFFVSLCKQAFFSKT